MIVIRATHGSRAAAGGRRGAHRLLAVALTLGLLAACGGVKIKPEPRLPPALIESIPAQVGLVIPADMRNFAHEETRWGVGWHIDIGAGHAQLVRAFFGSLFDDVQVFDSLDAARGASGLKAVFEPRIEQYSFVTARETGGRYYAVTIRYRINLYAPDGALADSYTLTGYGNALARGMSSGAPLERATVAAMRDAAAKFLVQFPEQGPGRQLARNEVVAPVPAESKADAGGIEAVPINEPEPDTSAAALPPVDAAAPSAVPSSGAPGSES